jgi:hypothetical protein
MDKEMTLIDVIRKNSTSFHPDIDIQLENLLNERCPEHELECPLGGCELNDCDGCPYSGDYHFVNGECVLRPIKEDNI